MKQMCVETSTVELCMDIYIYIYIFLNLLPQKARNLSFDGSYFLSSLQFD